MDTFIKISIDILWFMIYVKERKNERELYSLLYVINKRF